MKERRVEALRWLRQAENDLQYARLGLREGFSAQELSLGSDLHRELALLDQYYIPTRYPNGLPGGSPYEVYSREQAEAAIAVCDRVISFAHASLPAE